MNSIRNKALIFNTEGDWNSLPQEVVGVFSLRLDVFLEAYSLVRHEL